MVASVAFAPVTSYVMAPVPNEEVTQLLRFMPSLTYVEASVAVILPVM